MSLAWTTVAILVFLLPGIVFLAGLYSRERYSRDAVLKSPLIPLAYALGASFFVHGLYYTLIDPVFGHIGFPRVDLKYVFAILEGANDKELTLAKITENISDYRAYIFLYVLSTTVAGFLIGVLYSKLIVKGWLPSLSQHTWIKSLIRLHQKSYVYAYVLTRIQNGDLVLIYRGVLFEFYTKEDGTLSYLVLTGAKRGYLKLKQDKPVTTELTAIGETSGKIEDEATISSGEINSKIAHLLIEGEDISNVIFEEVKKPVTTIMGDELENLINNIFEERREQDKAKS